VDERRAELERKADKIAKSRDDILALFRTETPTTVLPGASLQLRGRAQVARHVADLLRDTSEDWLVMGVVTTPALYAAILSDLEAAVARGARARFLLPVSDRTVQDARALLPLAEIRARAKDSDLARRVTVLVSDHRTAMLIHWASIEGGENARDTALVTDDPAIASVIEHLVESLWEKAEPFEKAAARA
jgi:sugar-specific transcriptional regulator TrmB